ncbi:MAG: FecR domain-containing protein [Proteobacteria bacterium]|nr:FecR domain-containing protein [Pseudomonadota bacterium]
MSALVLGAATLALPSSAGAQSRVGVTSATTGDPRGKPPAAAERVLKVGIDVQANELITTGANDRAHLLFLDGSSLTVGPLARLTIDRFVYDPNTKTGDLAINASQGVLRFVGGKISKTRPVTVTTPSASLTIRGGIMLIDVQPGQTIATFIFGIEMTVTANGGKQVVTRPGWQVTTMAGATPGQAIKAVQGSLSPEFAKLEALRANNTGGNPDEAMVNSGFEAQNSGRGPTAATGPGAGAMNDATNAITGVNTQIQQQQKPVFIPPAGPPTTLPGTGGGNNLGNGQ